MRILTYCPMAPQTPKLYARTVTSIFNFDWSEPMQIVFGRNDTPRGTKYQDICQKHNEARQTALEGDFDALFFVENDMVLPKDILTRLLAVDADVAYGLYSSRHGHNRWLAFKDIGLHQGTSFSDEEDMARSVWGRVVRTQGVGMGCTLIHRNVLEAILFRLEPDELVADDWLFSLDCIAHGFVQKHDFGAVCGHIAKSGNAHHIIWPDIDAFKFNKFELLGGYKIAEISESKSVTITTSQLGLRTIWSLEDQNGEQIGEEIGRESVPC